LNLAVSLNWGSDDSEAPLCRGSVTTSTFIGSPVPELDDDGLGFRA
jgi:hypothetical protein